MCDKYLGQRYIKVNRSKCQMSGINARLPLLPVTRPTFDLGFVDMSP